MDPKTRRIAGTVALPVGVIAVSVGAVVVGHKQAAPNPVSITDNGAGLVTVRSPRGEWAKVETGGDLHLGRGVPMIQSNLAVARSPSEMVVFVAGPSPTPARVVYRTGGEVREEAIGREPRP